MSAANFNRLEVGLHDTNIAVKIAQTLIQWLGRRTTKLESRTDGHDTSIASINTLNGQQNTRLTALEKETAVEVKDVTLTAGSDPWPYCIKDTAVGLSTTRKNTAYDVDVYVKSYSGGRLVTSPSRTSWRTALSSTMMAAQKPLSSPSKFREVRNK